MNELLLETVINKLETVETSNNKIAEKVETLAEKQQAFNRREPKADTAGVEAHAAKAFERMTNIVAAMPKNVVHEKRVLLFPEFKAADGYRRLFNFLLYSLIATYAFFLLKYIVGIWHH